VRCWGDNGWGQLGDLTLGPLPSGTNFAGYTDVTALWAQGYHTCVRRSGGEIRCAGRNSDGDFGLGNDVYDYPSPVLAFPGAATVAPGDMHVCSLTAGVVRCTGRNYQGSVGNGRDSRVPARVLR
jgi:hypothetical protein